MDTSNSQEQKALTTGTPDSQEITADLEYFLFHGEILGKKEISNKTWIGVIDKFLYLLTPQLKYIDGLKTIEQIIVDAEWIGNLGTTKIKMRNAGIVFSPSPSKNLHKKTRGFFVLKANRLFSSDNRGTFKDTSLILTERGQWLKWEAITSESTCSSHFILLSNTGLCSLLNEAKENGYRLLDSLYLILYRAREQKQRRLSNIKNLEEKAKLILNRAR